MKLLSTLFLSLTTLVVMNCNSSTEASSESKSSSKKSSSDSEVSSDSKSTTESGPRELMVLAFTDFTSTDGIKDFQWDILTHIALFAWNMNMDGSIDKGSFTNSSIKNYITEAKKHDVEVIMTIGGAGRSDGFPDLTASKSNSQEFADNLLKEAKDLGLSGYDFDWEFPKTSEEKEDYLDFLKIVHETFKGSDLTVSIDSDAKEAPFNNNDYLKYLTWVNVMAYDQRPQQSSRTVTEEEWSLWSKAEVPNEMIVWGVPFYARNGTRTKPYQEISGEVDTKDDVYDEYYFFNGVNTVAWKTNYLYKNGYKGIMAWKLSFDETWDKEKSLLKSIGDELKDLGAKN